MSGKDLNVNDIGGVVVPLNPGISPRNTTSDNDVDSEETTTMHTTRQPSPSPTPPRTTATSKPPSVTTSTGYTTISRMSTNTAQPSSEKAFSSSPAATEERTMDPNFNASTYGMQTNTLIMISLISVFIVLLVVVLIVLVVLLCRSRKRNNDNDADKKEAKPTTTTQHRASHEYSEINDLHTYEDVDSVPSRVPQTSISSAHGRTTDAPPVPADAPRSRLTSTSSKSEAPDSFYFTLEQETRNSQSSPREVADEGRGVRFLPDKKCLHGHPQVSRQYSEPIFYGKKLNESKGSHSKSKSQYLKKMDVIALSSLDQVHGDPRPLPDPNGSPKQPNGIAGGSRQSSSNRAYDKTSHLKGNKSLDVKNSSTSNISDDTHEYTSLDFDPDEDSTKRRLPSKEEHLMTLFDDEDYNELDFPMPNQGDDDDDYNKLEHPDVFHGNSPVKKVTGTNVVTSASPKRPITPKLSKSDGAYDAMSRPMGHTRDKTRSTPSCSEHEYNVLNMT